MSEQMSPLYLKLLGETARLCWQELEPFFARGVVLLVAENADLPAIAEGLAEDDRAKVAAWLESGQLCKLDAQHAEDFLARDPDLWAVVVSPWVLIQERLDSHSSH